MGSPERRRKRKRTARARIGFMTSYEGSAGYCRRMSRLPNAAVLFCIFMMAAVCIRKAVMSTARARSAELWARNRAARSPLAVLLDEQHEIHYQAAALSDPSSKCLSHTNGGHKQPVTLGVFTCVADARFLLRSLIVMQGYAPMLVVDMGSPPAADAGGITSGQGWDLRERKQVQVNRRVKFREEPLPESSALVLIEAHKWLSAEDWTDVVLSVLQLLTPDGSIVLMEQRKKETPNRDVENPDGTWPGSVALRKAITELACGKEGLAVALGAFDEGLAVVRRAGEDLNRLERGCILPEDSEDEIVDVDEPFYGEGSYTATADSTSTASAAADTTSASTSTASAASGTASASTSTASAASGTASAAAGTASAANGTASSAASTASAANGIAASGIAASGTASAAPGIAASGTASAASGTTSAASGTALAANGTASAANGTSFAATGTVLAANGTALAANGTALAATGTVLAVNGTVLASNGTASAATGTASAANGTASAYTGTSSAATITASAVVGTVAPAPLQPLLHFEEMLSFALGADWTPEIAQKRFGGSDAVRKYAHRAGSRFFCVKNLARDSEGTGLKKQVKTKLSGDEGGGSGMLRSTKRNGASETDTTPEQIARACLEKHMKKHPKDVRGAYVLEMVLQAGGGAEGVDVDRQVARLREEACTERGEAGLSLWKALHARSADAGATGLLLP